jgi:hypothetical protein
MKVSPRNLQHRVAPLELEPEQFRRLGYRVIEKIATFLASLPRRPALSFDPLLDSSLQ